MPIDLAIVAAYLLLALWSGRRLARGRTTLRDYYLTGRRMPWWAVAGSIVATETSTVTVISVPGYAFGGDLTFLQLALGYLAGRVLVAFVLLPAYFSQDLLSAYQLLSARVGRAFGRCAAAVFLITRNVADGLRLFATALVLTAMLTTAAAALGLADPPQTPVVIAAIHPADGRGHADLHLAGRHDRGDLDGRRAARHIPDRRARGDGHAARRHSGRRAASMGGGGGDRQAGHLRLRVGPAA